MTSVNSFDVAIAGAGLAGNLLARQLRMALPDARIGLFDRAPRPSFKVGESTVELGSNYLLRRLGLSRYLYEHQLPKNGLRFFFDTEARDAALCDMSEIGSVALPYLPSFQVDRRRLEADLAGMNEEAGVPLSRGKIGNVRLAEDGAAHRFELLTAEGQRHEMSARWLVDATGRAGLLASQLGLRGKEQSHQVASVWGRFEGIADLDSAGDEGFRQRVNHTSRFLSTTHFCYPGYWIWFIPLGEGVTSVGVVMERDGFDEQWRSEAGFLAFLKSHRAIAQLLSGAALLDVMSYGQLAYRASQHFSSQRWALAGEAGSFTDPFYSPGTDSIAISNDFISDLIVKDLAGESIDERVSLYEQFLGLRYDASMRLYRSMYRVMGSYALFKLRWQLDAACYYNLWLEPYMRDQHLDLDYLRQQLRNPEMVLTVLDSFDALFRKVEGQMRKEGRYFTRNTGAFCGQFPTMRCAEGLGSDASSKGALARTLEAFNATRRDALQLLGGPDQGSESLGMRAFLSGQQLA